MAEERPLQGQVALITGASRGIGRAVALRLATDGAAVVLAARSQDAVAKVAEEIRQLGGDGRALALCCDVSNPTSVQETVDGAKREFGRLDIVVNNAGITRDNLLLRMSEEDWDAVLTTNLTGLFRVSKAAAKHMLRSRSGSIINITSVVGLVGNAGQANYAASKGGALAFTYTLAKELAPRGVRVNAVAPGFIDTDMTDALPEAAKEKVRGEIPLARFGAVEDIAGVVAFLSGPDSSYITGEVIRVDGGLAIG